MNGPTFVVEIALKDGRYVIDYRVICVCVCVYTYDK